MKANFRMSPAVMAVLVAMLFRPTVAAAQEPDGFTWSITPYLWAPRTKLDLAWRERQVGGAEISFKDLMDSLDSAFMVHAEGGRGHWSGFVDLTYLDASARDERERVAIDSESEQVFLDAAMAWWPRGVNAPLSLFGGLRYTGFDDRYRFSLDGVEVASRRNSPDYYDVLLGIRYDFRLGERWTLLTHADTSFGDSEGTYVLQANFSYVVGKRQESRILFGYQYKEAEFRDGDFKFKFHYHGPTAGFEFRF